MPQSSRSRIKRFRNGGSKSITPKSGRTKAASRLRAGSSGARDVLRATSDPGVDGFAPAQQTADLADHVIIGEGLGDEPIRLELERQLPVAALAARRQDQDRNIGMIGISAQVLEHIETAAPRQ